MHQRTPTPGGAILRRKGEELIINSRAPAGKRRSIQSITHTGMLRCVGQVHMVNCDCHWPLNVKLFPDADYPPFRSVAPYDRADKRGEQRTSAIADGLLSAQITVKSVHNLLSFTLLHGSSHRCLPLCELYSSLTPPIFLPRFCHCLVHPHIDQIDPERSHSCGFFV